MRLREDISTAATEYGMVLLDERAGRYWQLSHVAALVVEQLGLGNDVDVAVEAVTARFDIDRDQARQDVDVFLAQLVSAKLVTA